jgi:hypothetical protein
MSRRRFHDVVLTTFHKFSYSFHQLQPTPSQVSAILNPLTKVRRSRRRLNVAAG